MGMLAIAAVLAVGAAPELRVSGGLDAASGTYGYDEATTAVSRSLALDLSLGAWGLRVSGAHAAIDGPADIVLVDPVASPTRGARARTPAADRREGFTDLSLAARWSPAPIERPWWYSLGISATLPTGDPGLGRDDSDLFAHADFGWDAGPVSLAASVGYRVIADPLWRDTASLAVSLSRTAGRGATVGLGFDIAQSPARGFGAEAAVSGFAGRPLGRLGRVDIHAWKGLTEAAGDIGGGLTLSRRFGL